MSGCTAGSPPRGSLTALVPAPPAEEDERHWGVSQALRAYMRRVHAPLLRRPAAQAAVLALFVGAFLLSCAMLPRLEK